MNTKAALKLIQSWREMGCDDEYRVTLLDLERIVEALAEEPEPSAWPALSALGLSNRVRIVLRRNGIETVPQLCALSADDLRQRRLIGRQTLDEIRIALLKARLQLRGDEWTCPG